MTRWGPARLPRLRSRPALLVSFVAKRGEGQHNGLGVLSLEPAAGGCIMRSNIVSEQDVVEGLRQTQCHLAEVRVREAIL